MKMKNLMLSARILTITLLSLAKRHPALFTLAFKGCTMIDLLKIPASDAERIAYAEGFTMAAELFKRIDELEADKLELKQENEILRDQLADAKWSAES